MKEEKTEGLLIRAIPYLGTQKIFKVFTKEKGLLTLISKKSNLQPFCMGQWVYVEKEKGIFPLKEASIVEHFEELKTDFQRLSSAGKIAKALLDMALGGPQETLYALTIAYFKKLPSFQTPQTLSASFLLKLLHHEGVLSLEPLCSVCKGPMTSLTQGESTCLHHSRLESIYFSPQEKELLLALTYAKRFQDLQTLYLAEDLENKIEKIYYKQI